MMGVESRSEMIGSAQTALISFFLRMLATLQKRGTVVAMDLDAYGEAV